MERNIVYIAVFAALIAVLGLLPKFTLASGIPITAQSLGIMLCGTILGAKRGALAVLLFVALVALGLPLLAGGRGGLGVFASPSVGFLVGFPIAAYVIGFVMERTGNMPVGVLAAIAAIFGGILVLYSFGIPGLMYMAGMGFKEALFAMSPFMLGDLLKAVLAGLITGSLYKARPDAVLSKVWS